MVGARRCQPRSLLEDPGVAEPDELVRRHPEELPQHVLGVLTQAGRWRVDAGLQGREAHGVGLDRMAAENGMLDGAEVLAVGQLRVIVQVAEVLDR